MKTVYKNTNFLKEFQNLKKGCYSLNKKNAKKIYYKILVFEDKYRDFLSPKQRTFLRDYFNNAFFIIYQ